MEHYKHYITVDGRGRILDGWSNGPHPERNVAGAVCINERGGYQFRLCLGGQENPALHTTDGISLYRWDGKAAVSRGEEEIGEDRADLSPVPPTSSERLDALEAAIERGVKPMTQQMLDGLASAIYASRLSIMGEAVDTDDKRIRASGLYPDWTPGPHTQGDIYNAAGQTWETLQDYDNAVYPDIRPGEAAWYTFNRPLHGTSPETARPWVKPQHGTTDIYHSGEYMIWIDGSVRCALRDTDFSPEEYAPDWETVSQPEAEEPQNWPPSNLVHNVFNSNTEEIDISQ